MSKVNTLLKIIIGKEWFGWVPDRIYLCFLYRLYMGRKLNLKNPQRFTEKLQWLKIYDRKPIYITMVDKYTAKDYVAEKIGESYVIPTIGVWNSPEMIDFDRLPDKVVLKTTHDSGGIRIIDKKEGYDREEIMRFLRYRMSRNLSNITREWPYRGVKPRIIAEEYLEDTCSDTHELRDYKFFCFSGKVKMMKIDYDRFTNHHANYYGRNRELLPFIEIKYPRDLSKDIQLPSHFDEMISLAEKLSDGLRFLRVDFYEINDKVYFGELTFYPASGFGPFEPDEWDLTIGSWLDLN